MPTNNTPSEGVTGYTYVDGPSETDLPPTRCQRYVGRVGEMQNVGTEKCSFLVSR